MCAMAAFTSGTWVVPHKLSLRRRRKNTTKATTCRLERTRQGRMGYLSLFRTRGSEAPTSGHQQPRYPRARLDCPAYRAGLAAFNRENTRQPPTLRGVQRPFPTLILIVPGRLEPGFGGMQLAHHSPWNATRMVAHVIQMHRGAAHCHARAPIDTLAFMDKGGPRWSAEIDPRKDSIPDPLVATTDVIESHQSVVIEHGLARRIARACGQSEE